LAHLLLARNDTHDRDMHSIGRHQLMTQEDAAETADDWWVCRSRGTHHRL